MNDSIAVVEYGRLLNQLSSLLHLVTRFSLQKSLTLDLNYVQGNELRLIDKSSLDLSNVNDQIESVESRLDILEKWVNR